MGYMTSDQKAELFPQRAEALAKIVEARRSRAEAALKALTCAEQIAATLPRTAAGMLDDIASEADAVMEFHEAEQEILLSLPVSAQFDRLVGLADKIVDKLAAESERIESST